MIMEITRKYELIAGHYLPNVPQNHKCKRPHGHNYEIEVSLQGPINATDNYGWVMDYWDLDKIVDPILNTLDHQMLNEIKGLENPTAEVIAKWFFDKLELEIPTRMHVRKIRVFETRTCIATVINDGKPWSTL